MVAFPPCKINLGLHILRKRSDGYHDLETCFFPVPWTDMLEIIPASTLSFTSSGLQIPGTDSDNLCLKAYRLLSNDFDIPPVQIHLHKIIPMGAGLGGGSSDAAWTLRMLNQMFSLNIGQSQLMGYAAKLGSDCAFFIQDKPMMGTGRGEVLTPIELSLSGKWMVLVKPDVHVSTADAYAGVSPKLPTIDLSALMRLPMEQWRDQVINDFEKSVFAKFPMIDQLKNELYNAGATYASMSGSGSTVFGIFDKKPTLSYADSGLLYWSNLIH